MILALGSIGFGELNARTIDSVLKTENAELGVTKRSVGLISDMAFIRRASIDLIGRIPTVVEIREYQSWPAAERRSRLVEKLIEHPRFADRWTVFFADLLRLRSNVDGGASLIAHVHRSISQDKPYNELAAGLISTNGKSGRTPEVGFILGDNADPLAMASVTAQVFMGVRISCAQCHDHPFDVWTRKDFFGMAAFFGKTRRYQSNFTRVVYTSESEQNTVMWPPEDVVDGGDRKALVPVFPFPMIDSKEHPEFITRYEAYQQKIAAAEAVQQGVGPSVDSLLADADNNVKAATGGGVDLAVAEAQAEISKIDVKASLYKRSEYRERLAEQVTSPRNRLFAESFVNRMWHSLIGRGFVEPVDDFRADNPPSHPQTLGFIADEFVANGYRFKHLVKMIMLSDVYQQQHVPVEVTEVEQRELETAFLANSMRRMLSESLYDSMVTAGHLFELKYSPGQNEKIIEQEVRVLIGGEGQPDIATAQVQDLSGAAAAMPATQMDTGSGYKLEEAIELDFDALLEDDDTVAIDRMVVKSAEELEAERMAMQRQQTARPGMKYETKIVSRTVDDNPRFSSSLRMVTPAPVGHFVRVFGQTARTDLGDTRDDTPSMRQSLMMLNGRLTHQASRVGDLEPMQKLLVGDKPQLTKATTLAYHEILTRDPTAQELEVAKEIITAAENVLEGMADLRWLLLNSNEFRFLP